MALITKIKEYREKVGMKQSELAEQVGARRETIVQFTTTSSTGGLTLPLIRGHYLHASKGGYRKHYYWSL